MRYSRCRYGNLHQRVESMREECGEIPGHSGSGSLTKCMNLSRRQCQPQKSLGTAVAFICGGPNPFGRSPVGPWTNPIPHGPQFSTTEGLH